MKAIETYKCKFCEMIVNSKLQETIHEAYCKNNPSNYSCPTCLLNGKHFGIAGDPCLRYKIPTKKKDGEALFINTCGGWYNVERLNYIKKRIPENAILHNILTDFDDFIFDLRQDLENDYHRDCQ